MRVTKATAERDGRCSLVKAWLQSENSDAPIELWYRFEGATATEGGIDDAIAAGMLTPAMFEGECLQLSGGISPTLRDSLQRAQELLTCWWPHLNPIAVSGADETGNALPAARAPGIGSCFTGGVDSWYTLLKHRHRITHLVLIRGFDIGLSNDVLWSETRAQVARIADAMGKRLVVCETNLREIADKRRASWGRRHDGDFWGECLHGAALASVGHLLRGEIGELIVPASHEYRGLIPWGSSPLLDQNYSSEIFRLTHDGCEASRFEKTVAIAGNDLALGSLRVCYVDSSKYNCGRCEKCLRTLIALRLCGALPKARTFPDGLSLDLVRRLVVPGHLRQLYGELLAEAKRRGDRKLVSALRTATGRSLSLLHASVLLRRGLRNSSLPGILKDLRVPRGAFGFHT